jgi:glutaredoxin 3
VEVGFAMNANANVTIYTTAYCGFCTRAKRLLNEKSVQYTEIDVESRPDLRTWLVKASGQRTVPQVFINGKSVGGFSDISELDRRGALDPMLAEAPAPGAQELPK